MKKIFISAGEASGDMYAARLVKALTAIIPGVSFTAFGGGELTAAGAEVKIPLVRYAVVGFAAVISKLPGIAAAYFKAKRLIKKEKPDMLIVTDYPGFHMMLIKAAKKLGVKKIVWFITPQVWLWGEKRVDAIKKYCDFVINILPFEKEIFEKSGVKAFYFGHPLAHILKDVVSAKTGRVEIGVFPGSRKNEIRDFMTDITKACGLIKMENPNVSFRAFAANTVNADEIKKPFAKAGLGIEISGGGDYEKRKGLTAAIVKSGTAALETALLKVPFTAVYRMKGIDYMIIKSKAKNTKVKHVTLPNIIAGREIIRELIQKDFTPENTASEINSLLKGGGRAAKMHSDFNALEAALLPAGNPFEAAAEKIAEALS